MSAHVAELSEEEIRRRRLTKVTANILHLCHTLEGIRDEFIPLLPALSDKKIIEIRGAARIVGVWAWVIECACDAEMFDRVEAAKRGPKTGDSEDRDAGKVAAAGQQAYLDGKSVRTVYRNAQIFNVFGLEFIATRGKELQDKAFWIYALDAPDPHEAIETLVEKKADNPFLEPKDALREIDALRGKHEEAKNKFIEEFRTIARKTVGEWIRFTARPAIEQLKTSCPDPKLTKFWEDTDNQLREREEAMLIEDAEAALFYAWGKGYATEAQMCDFTGLLPLEIRTTLLSLQEKGYFVEQNQQWKPAKARGPRSKEWKRTSKPLPHINVVPGETK